MTSGLTAQGLYNSFKVNTFLVGKYQWSDLIWCSLVMKLSHKYPHRAEHFVNLFLKSIEANIHHLYLRRQFK